MDLSVGSKDDIDDLLALFKATGQNISALNRTYHYLFAHRLIPTLFFSDPQSFIDALRIDGNGFLIKAWQEVKRQTVGGQEMDDETRDDLNHDIRTLTNGITIATVMLPLPETIAEAYFVSAVYRATGNKDSIQKILTLEYGLDRTGRARTVMGAWTAEGEYLKYGDGPEPQLDAFLKSIMHKLDAN